jgi:hypothetical protein
MPKRATPPIRADDAPVPTRRRTTPEGLVHREIPPQRVPPWPPETEPRGRPETLPGPEHALPPASPYEEERDTLP